MTKEKSMLSSSTGRMRTRRGAQLLEFAITLPLFLFMLLFSLDMGRMVFLSGVVHDVAFTSARAGAQVGAAGDSNQGASYRAYKEAIEGVPGNRPDSSTFQVFSGRTCSAALNDSNNFVEVKVTQKVFFITPGLNRALGVMNNERTTADGAWILPAIGLARCEVVRTS